MSHCSQGNTADASDPGTSIGAYCLMLEMNTGKTMLEFQVRKKNSLYVTLLKTPAGPDWFTLVGSWSSWNIYQSWLTKINLAD